MGRRDRKRRALAGVLAAVMCMSNVLAGAFAREAFAKDMDTVEGKDRFSIYAVVGMAIEKNVLTHDGKNYKVSLTYGADAGIPEGADLEVLEILPGSDTFSEYEKSYEEYISKTEDALGWETGSVSYARVFDISIVKDDEKVQPRDGKSVDVKIELEDAEEENDLSVVHFADGSKDGDVVESATDGQIVSFEAEGFSAYVIVQGPSVIPIGWNKVSSIDELIEMGSSGLYIGHTDGYYYGNTIVADGSRTGIMKTKPPQSTPPEAASKYYFEKVDGSENQVYAYCYAADGTTKQYVYNGGNNSLSFKDEEGSTGFTVTRNSNGTFKLSNGAWYWNMQGGAGGTRFCAYNNANDGNNNIDFWYSVEVTDDPYELSGKSYGLMNWAGGVAGKALMASAGGENTMDALALTVMAKSGDNGDKLFVPDDSAITLWRFEWVEQDTYYLKASVDGSVRYLNVTADGLSLVSEPNESENCVLQVIPGTGTHAGEICLKSKDGTLTYSGTVAGGFTVGGSAGSEWLKLVDISELTSDYFMPYSASKVSVSDACVTNGSRIIVYTRVWNDNLKAYEFYAVDHDGSLVRCFESGDDIEWVGSHLNSLLWNFVEYYWEGTNEPNYYYELYNPYSDRFIAPQVSDGQILSEDTIGINLNGRRNGQYYSSILAWDENNYSYVGLKADRETDKIISCPRSEAEDFYFAIVKDLNVDDQLSTVSTVDHTQYGITMKIVDFGTKIRDWNEQDNFLGSNEGGAVFTTDSGLLSTDLGKDGYPTNRAGVSMQTLYANAEEVNHLFIESTYYASGYYEYDSTQNFAALNRSTGNFTVYNEIGTMDGTNKNTLKHGQFMPYNDLQAGVFAAVNGKNLYNSVAQPLSEDNPRKYEQMYLVRDPNYYFGVELEASFTQPPNGLDDWGHDIIYEFTGDDDFWLYVDGELVIDLGGIHSALAGSVNYSTGDVVVNGSHTTLRDIFEKNYRERNKNAGEEEVADYLAQYFDAGSIFKDYSQHTMRIFYMERGAGASNLHMRFNLASVKPGTVELTKELDGVDKSESVLAEFPYQIKYKKKRDAEEYYLSNKAADSSQKDTDYVFYKDTVNPVTYNESLEIDGITYNDVFMLKPGEVATINFPTLGPDAEEIDSYSIVECGVNTEVYSSVKVNNADVSGISGTDYPGNRKDYATTYAAAADRAQVKYTNTVNPEALRTLTFKKRLYREDGTTELNQDDDRTTFDFRLYLGTEFDSDPDAANMHTYHVKNAENEYCTWDAGTQRFFSTNVSDFESLSAEQKIAASFTTSMNGSLSKMPVGYTVEVRNVLAGTKFKIIERPSEIPDGYSFQKYVYYPNVADTDTKNELSGGDTAAQNGVADIVVAKRDPHIDICNLKGWGLRVNKIWSDADYMSERDATYFAVFTDDGQGALNLVSEPNTIRQLKYGESSLYWYFQTLPVAGVSFDRYEIREVKLTNPVVNAEGYLTSYSKIDVISEGDELKLSGKQKGETGASEFTYTVRYTKGEVEQDSNVRVDTAANNRPGIVLKKTDWNGNPLADAVFTLTDPEGDLIGTFTSDASGLITVAFLRDNVNYTLTETMAPDDYHGLEAPMTITLDNHQVSVSGGVEEAWYSIDQSTGTPTLTIKNRPYTFRAVKLDGDTGNPIAGVKFQLHKQYTVDGVTQFETTPMAGYEELKTDGDGIIPKLDNTLPVGTYQLREKEAADGYAALSDHISFHVSDTGTITLISAPDTVSLPGDDIPKDGSIEYLMSVRNYRTMSITLKKTDDSDQPLTGAKFQLCKYGSTWEAVDGYREIDMTSTSEVTLSNLTSGRYRLEETLAPDGYVITNRYVYFNLSTDNAGSAAVTLTGETGEEENANSNASVSGATITVKNISSAALPATGGRGTNLIYLLGILFITIAGAGLAMRRRRAGFVS